MKVLSPPLARMARVLAETLFDQGKGVPADRLDWVVLELDRLLFAAGFKTTTAFKAALVAVEVSPPFLIRRLIRFSNLGAPERLDCLDRFEKSPATVLFVVIKLLLGMVYFEHPELLRELGLDVSIMWPGGVPERPTALHQSAPAGQPVLEGGLA